MLSKSYVYELLNKISLRCLIISLLVFSFLSVILSNAHFDVFKKFKSLQYKHRK